MATPRALLEVLKFLDVSDLLRTDSVCVHWQRCSRSDEAWLPHLLIPVSSARSVRDTCIDQLSRPHFLVDIQGRCLTAFDVVRRTRTALVVPSDLPLLAQRRRVSWVSLPTAVYLQYRGQEACESALVHIPSGCAERLPRMRGPRECAGLLYFAGSVYLFGGLSRRAEVLILESERLLVATQQWTPLPQMKQRRHWFTPARIHAQVYIVGGFCASNEMEVFCLRSERFLPSVWLPLQLTDFPSTAADFNGSLLLLGGRGAWVWRAGSVQALLLRSWPWFSYGEVVVHRRTAYLLASGWHTVKRIVVFAVRELSALSFLFGFSNLQTSVDPAKVNPLYALVTPQSQANSMQTQLLCN